MGDRCVFSGEWCPTDPVHIVRQGYSVALQDDERNVIPGKRTYHDMFDNGRFEELYDMFPWRCRAIVERMKSLDHHYTYRFVTRNLREDQWKGLF
jgi:hypothetical protein